MQLPVDPQRATIKRLLAMARVQEWPQPQLQSVWIPSDLLLGNPGQCRVMAEMRASRAIVDQDGLWFEGTDGAHQFVSVKLGQSWVKAQL